MSHVNNRFRFNHATTPVDVPVTSVNSQTNTTTVAPETGDPYDLSRRVVRSEPVVSFTTEALQIILDLIGLSGLCFGPSKTYTSARYLANLLDGCGTEGRSDGTDHLMGALNQGNAYLGKLRVEQGKPATISVNCHGLTDKTSKAQPLSQVYDQALISGFTDPDAFQAFAFYGFNLLGTALEDVSSVEIDYQVTIKKPPVANGTIWPSKLYASKFRQIMRLELGDPTLLDRVIAADAAAVTQANTELQLVRDDPDSGWVAENVAQHLRIPINGKAYVGSAYEASGGEPSTADLTIESTGVTAPVLHNTDVVLPT